MSDISLLLSLSETNVSVLTHTDPQLDLIEVVGSKSSDRRIAKIPVCRSQEILNLLSKIFKIYRQRLLI